MTTRFVELCFGARFWDPATNREILIKAPDFSGVCLESIDVWNAFNPVTAVFFRINPEAEVCLEKALGEPEKQPTSGDLVDLVVGSWEAARVDAKDHVAAIRAAIDTAQKHLKHLIKSRNVACVATKLDEARMWLNEMEGTKAP